MTAALFALGAYLLGSIPFAILVSRAMGLTDPRTYGSKNIGATNVLRSGNRLAALLTLVGDAGKGWAAGDPRAGAGRHGRGDRARRARRLRGPPVSGVAAIPRRQGRGRRPPV
jgi:hypothetical protein